MTNGVDEFLNATGKAIEIFPKLYDDGLQETVQETGKIIARIPRAINAALSSLDIWIENKEYNVDATKALLAKKLEDIDPSKIVAPEAYVAVPAIQAISYSMDSEELRNLYANLLSKSMQVDRKDSVHPSFVEIIKQLSPMDANILKLLSKHTEDIREFFPLITLYRVNHSGEGRIVKQNILEPKFSLTKENIDSFELSIDNLARLKLISIDFDIEVSDEYLYDEIVSTQVVENLMDEITSSNSDYCEPYIKRGSLAFSPLGIAFIEICLF